MGHMLQHSWQGWPRYLPNTTSQVSCDAVCAAPEFTTFNMLRARWLGRVPFAEALWIQRAVARYSQEQYLLMMEHPHIYTAGVRAQQSSVLVPLDALGAKLVRADRGGDVTYHGPGQLVAYPVLTVAGPGAGPQHVRRMEGFVAGVLENVPPDISSAVSWRVRALVARSCIRLAMPLRVRSSAW